MGQRFKAESVGKLEGPGMISEQNFSSSFTSIWHEIIPLADTYWRRENLRVSHWNQPLDNSAPVKLRGFVNELAFEVFRKSVELDVKVTDSNLIAILTDSVGDVSNYILRITKDKNSVSSELDSQSKREVISLASRLLEFFHQKDEIIFRPRFAGCGVVASCEGDLIYKDCLYEIKAGDRGFRVSDLKQLLIYSSLAFIKEEIKFPSVGLYNPRNGHAWKRTLDDLCMELSGMRESDVLSNIATSMMRLSVSR